MDRHQIMQELKVIYEEILQGGDGRLFLQREDQVDQLFRVLQSREEEAYSQMEMDMLKTLSELNHSLKSLLAASKDRLQYSHAMSHKVSKQYDSPTPANAYFYDRKY